MPPQIIVMEYLNFCPDARFWRQSCRLRRLSRKYGEFDTKIDAFSLDVYVSSLAIDVFSLAIDVFSLDVYVSSLAIDVFVLNFLKIFPGGYFS